MGAIGHFRLGRQCGWTWLPTETAPGHKTRARRLERCLNLKIMVGGRTPRRAEKDPGAAGRSLGVLGIPGYTALNFPSFLSKIPSPAPRLGLVTQRHFGEWPSSMC